VRHVASETADAGAGVGAGVNSGESVSGRGLSGNLSYSSALGPEH
jgi:hypothetical protein